MLTLEYTEPTLLGLNTPLGDLIGAEAGGGCKESALTIGGGAGDAGFGIGKRRRLTGGGAADIIGGGGAGGSITSCSVSLATSSSEGFSFCLETL